MKKNLFFSGLVKRGAAMLVLTAMLTITQADYTDKANVPGTECSVCCDDEDEEIYFGPTIPEQ